MANNKEMSEEEFLKRHLEETSGKQNFNPAQSMVNQMVTKQEVDSTRTTDLQYFNFDVKDLPCGKFYPAGTMLMIRAAQVKEIQAYSMVDDNNFYDIVEKMNDMLQACVRVKYSNGNIASYLDIKDQDRLYLIFTIRELTFQSGSSLAVSVQTPSGDVQLELKRENFKLHEM